MGNAGSGRLRKVWLLGAAWVFAAAPCGVQAAGDFSATTLQQVPLGALGPGKWSMKSTMLVMEPGAKIPFHVHAGPGLRYVLEGAITIVWKDGKTQTFDAGSTYFEGRGENHPAGTISARNDGKGPCRVLIVEVDPEH